MGFHEMIPQPKMLIVIAAYFVVVFIFAFLAKKKENRKSIKDFALAGKGLGSFILMATFMASWMGGGAVAGSINSIAYSSGLWPSICYASGSIFAIVILYMIGPFVRKRGKITTAALIEDSALRSNHHSTATHGRDHYPTFAASLQYRHMAESPVSWLPRF